MTDADASAPAVNRGFGPVVEFASRVLAPAGVLTAMLFYFGYVREQALFAYFGVDLGSLGFTTTDYLVRSTGTVFVPVATLLVAAVAAVAGHYLLLYRPADGPSVAADHLPCSLRSRGGLAPDGSDRALPAR